MDPNDRASYTFRPAWFITQQTGLVALTCLVLAVLGTVAVPGSAKLPTAVALSIAALYVLYRFASTHVTISASGIAWSDWRRSRQLPWSGVAKVTVTRPHPFPPVQIQPFTVLLVHLHSGEQFPIYGSALLRVHRRDELVRVLAHSSHEHGITSRVGREDLSAALERPATARR
jgi:hypothetical protein